MQKIGAIGIGYIGKLLVERLIEADYDVVGYDIDPEKEAWLTEQGGEWVDSAAAVADDTDAIFLAVPGATAVRQTFEGEGGLLETLDADQLVIDTSTTGPDAAAAAADLCADRGVGFVTAPLTRNAPAGGVHMMVGGTEDDYARATPLLDVVSRRHRQIGTPEAAQTFKLILQARYACQEAVDAEIVAFARDQGLDPRPYEEFLGLDIEESYLERDFNQAIEGMGGLAIWHKDLGYGLEVARESNTATPIANAVFEAYKHTVRTASDDEGHAATILRYWEGLNDR